MQNLKSVLVSPLCSIWKSNKNKKRRWPGNLVNLVIRSLWCHKGHPCFWDFSFYQNLIGSTLLWSLSACVFGVINKTPLQKLVHCDVTKGAGTSSWFVTKPSGDLIKQALRGGCKHRTKYGNFNGLMHQLCAPRRLITTSSDHDDGEDAATMKGWGRC